MLALALSVVAAPAAAQTVDLGASIRLENERRWTQGQLRALEAEVGRLRTDQTIRRMEARRAPDATISARQAQLEAAEVEALLRATQAASTANASRLRASGSSYDQRLRALGYASSLPLEPRR